MIIFGLMFFKGVLASLAGPAPNYDMQRILATRNPREACMMNGLVNVVLYFPRYMMITGITVLALAFCMPQLRAMDKPDFEKILPIVLSAARAGRRRRFPARRPAGGVHVEFRRHDQRRARLYRQRHLQALHQPAISGAQAGGRAQPPYVHRCFWSLASSSACLPRASRTSMMWLVGALYGGFVMANVLKWYWWRFNGYGYFWGMVTGIGSAMLVPRSCWSATGSTFSTRFPAVFVVSLIGCLLGTLLTKPEDDEILKKFYRHVNPWGWWGPIREKVIAGGSVLPAQPRCRARPQQCRRRHRLATLPRHATDLPRASGLAVVLADSRHARRHLGLPEVPVV